MGETTDQIERHIAEARNDLGDNISELGEKVKTAVDWRTQVAERPMTMMALAFGGGVLLSALLPDVPSLRRRSRSEDEWTAPEDYEVSVPAMEQPRTATQRKVGEAWATWDALKGALAGVATAKLSGYIEDLLPGFRQEFAKARTGDRFERRGPSASGQPAWQKSSAPDAD